MINRDELKGLEEHLKFTTHRFKQEVLKQKIDMEEIFTEKFMQKFTNYPSFFSFYEADNFCSESWQLLEQKETTELDNHVQKHTEFKNWNAMLLKASECYILGDYS